MTPAAGGCCRAGIGRQLLGCGCRVPWRWAGGKAAGLEVPGRVEGEFADQLAGVAADDADVQVIDQEGDAGAAAGGAESDVVEPAVVAQRDGAAGIDGVVADSVVRRNLRRRSGSPWAGRHRPAAGVRRFSARWGRTVL